MPLHPRLSELREYLAQQRRTLLAAAAAVPTERWTERPGPDRWSVSLILEHLHRVESGTAALLARLIASARDAGHPAETETSSVLGSLEHLQLADRGRPLVAPPVAEPSENPDRATIERRLTDSRAALLAAIENADGLALGEIRHTSVRFGDLNLYQWILFIGEHEKRHALQVEEVAGVLVN